MQTLVKHIEYGSRSDTFRLWHLTDTHLGARAVNEALLKRHIKQIADDPNAYWIHGGDAIDCIGRTGDKRYRESTQADWLHGVDDVIDAQEERAIDLFSPIASKCLGFAGGNHEENALKYYGRDVYRRIVKGVAKAAGVEPHTLALGIQGFILLRFRRKSRNSSESGSGWTLPLFIHHGAGGGRLAGGDALMLERALGDFAADLILIGHRHKHRILSRAITEPTDTGVRIVSRIAMMSASYVESYVSAIDDFPVTTYAEHLLLPATVIGATPITIDPDARQFHVTMSSGGAGIGDRLPSLKAAAS